MPRNIFVKFVFILILTMPFVSSAQDIKQPTSIQNALNIITAETSSVMGNEVARQIGMILFLEKYLLRSGLVLEEKKITSNTNEILLKTPLRTITAHRFIANQPRSWSKPFSVAQQFITAVQKEGLINSKNN